MADDQPDVRFALRFLLKGEGFGVDTADSPPAVDDYLRRVRPDLVLMDLNYTRDTTSGEEGLDLLTRIHSLESAPPVVVMTAWGSIEVAVEAMRRGARDFVLKPWDNASLINTIRKHLQVSPEERRKPAEDLEIARQVQAELFPKHPPELATLACDGHCRQAGLIGGDYYDYIDLEPGRAALVLADVSGKGIAAALLMANLQAMLRSLAGDSIHDLAEFCRAINRQFYDSTPPERFATVFYGLYDDHTRLLRYVNCGHNPPFLIRGAGDVERLQPTALVLGAFKRFEPGVREVEIGQGDLLAVYSDGLIDAPLAESGESDEQALLALLLRRPPPSAEEITTTLASGHALQFDDMTLVLAAGR